MLQTLIDVKAPIEAVLSLSPTDARGVSDYADLRPLAESSGIQHRYIKQVNAPSVVSYVAMLKPDVLLIIGWSQLVRNEIMSIPRYGCIGAHPALLPHNRGRAVIPWVLIQDEPETGMTLFHIDSGIDSGDIIAQERLQISDVDTAETLYRRAVDALCKMLREHLPAILTGTAPRVKQDERFASYCARRGPEDGLINWEWPTRSIFNLVRAVSHPYPGAYTYYGTRKVTIWSVRPEPEKWAGTPGQILRLDPTRGALIKTGDGAVWFNQVECDGNLFSTADFFTHVGDKLGLPGRDALLRRIMDLEEKVSKWEGNMQK